VDRWERTSTHIYADYERTLVEQELRGYGVDDLDDHPPVPPEASARRKRR
jgi:hypothetical protein